MRLNILLIIMFVILQGCSSVYYMKMDAVETDGQKVIYNDGKETIVSQMTHFVSLAPFRELNSANGKTSFILFVQNLCDEPITVSNDNVSVTFRGTTEKWASQNIKVQSYNDIILEIESEEAKQRSAAAWLAVANAINAQNAARSTSTTYNSGSVYGNYNANSYGTYANNPYSMNTMGNLSGTYSGFSTTTTYDPAKAQELTNQNNQNFRNNLNNIAAQAQSSRQLIDALFMKAQTIMPGQSHGGLVVSDTRSMNQEVEGNFEVVVSVGKEEHRFIINRSFHSKQQ